MLNYNSGEIQSSITKFERMLKTNLIYFFDAQEFEDIIIHYLGFGEKQLAKKALKMGLEQHPSSHGLMLLQSEIFILDEKYDVALQVLEYVEKLNPYDEEVHLQKASIASKKGDHKSSINYLHEALRISEDPGEIWNLLGMEHLLAEEYEEASCFFKNCVNDNPEDYPSLFNLMHCYDQLERTEPAIEALNEILEYDPYCEVAWHQLGKVLIKARRTKEALSALDFAIISDDTFTGAYIEKGKLLETLGRINEAIDNYKLALNTTEPTAFIYKCIGRCHENLGNFQLTKQFYLKSIKLEPGNENSWESLLLFLVTQKDLKKVKYYLKKALETNSDSIDLWKRAVEIYILLEKKEEAIEACKKLINLNYYYPDIVLKVIDFLIENKKWLEAHSLAEDVFASFPKNRDIALRVAGCCLCLNRIEEGNYLLNPQELYQEEKDKFLILFPEFKSHLSKV